MLKMRKPLELKCFRRPVGFGNGFHEKIRANYLLAAADFRAEDLLHLVMDPPSLFPEEGNTVFIHHWKLELLTQLINRLLLSLTVKKPMTFQDGVFVDRALLGLGIRDSRSFLRKLAKAFQMEQNSEALLRLYRETEGLRKAGEARDARKTEGEKAGKEPAALWKSVYLRLDTARLCRETREFIKNSIRLRRKAGPVELLAAEPARNARYVELSLLRDFISGREERAVRPPSNGYERARTVSSLPAGILFSLVHRVYTGVYLAAGEKTAAEKNWISIEPDFYKTADSFLQRFDCQREEGSLEEPDGRRIEEERTFMEKLALSYLRPEPLSEAADKKGRIPAAERDRGLELEKPEGAAPEKGLLPAARISFSDLTREMKQFFFDRRSVAFEAEGESGTREGRKELSPADPIAAALKGRKPAPGKRKTDAAASGERKNPVWYESPLASKASAIELIFRKWRNEKRVRDAAEGESESGRMEYKRIPEQPHQDIREQKTSKQLRPGVRIQKAAVLLWKQGEGPDTEPGRHKVKKEGFQFSGDTGQAEENAPGPGKRTPKQHSKPVRDLRVRERDRIWLPVERKLFHAEGRSVLSTEREKDGQLSRQKDAVQNNGVDPGSRPAQRSGYISFPGMKPVNRKRTGDALAARLTDTAQRCQGKRGKRIKSVIPGFEGLYRKKYQFKIKRSLPRTLSGNASLVWRTRCFLRCLSVPGNPGGQRAKIPGKEEKRFPVNLLWEQLLFSDSQEKERGSGTLPEESRPSRRTGGEESSREESLGKEGRKAVRALTRPAPPVTQTLKERLDEWNLRQVETYQRMLRTAASEETEDSLARMPAREKTGRAANAFLLWPREAAERFQNGQSEGAEKTAPPARDRSERYLSRLDETSRRIYREILSFGTDSAPSWIRKAPDMAVMKYLSAVSDKEPVPQDKEKASYKAFRESKERYNREALVYRQTALWPEEGRKGEREKERVNEKEQVRSYVEKISKIRAETAELPPSGQIRETVEKMVEKTMNGRLDAISERVYQRLEKRLKSERARRGLY